MTSEVTKRDRAHNAVPEAKKLYGKGSRVLLDLYADDVQFILLNYINGFWKVLIEPTGKITTISEDQIRKILHNGKWEEFDPKKWKKI